MPQLAINFVPILGENVTKKVGVAKMGVVTFSKMETSQVVFPWP